MENYFGIFGIFRRKNQREIVSEVATRQGERPYPREPTVRRLMLFFCLKKANFMRKIGRKIHPNRSYGSPDIKETVKGQNLRTKKQRETERQIQSNWGSRPSHAMETMDQRGNPSPI